MNFNKEFIASLKEKISIVDVISDKIKLRRAGKDWFGLCPFHKEKTGSFKVDANSGYYYCFGCGAHGDAITFIKEFDRISFQEAVSQIAERYGIALPADPSGQHVSADPNQIVYKILQVICSWFHEQLHSSAGDTASDYLKSRHISAESIEKFQLGFAPDNDALVNYLLQKGFARADLLKTGVFNQSKYGSALVNRYKARLIFPIFDIANRCVGFGGRIMDNSQAAKYINSPENDVFIKSKHLYGYSIAKKERARDVILTEGYLDVISMHQAGFSGAVSPLGTSISETQMDMCWKLCDEPVVLLDGDVAGVKASYRWIDKILPELKTGKSFRFARLPQGVDPDILLSQGNVDTVESTLKNSMPLAEWMWSGAFQLYPSETPEQTAAILSMLESKINSIKDERVRTLYAKMLKHKERSLYNDKKQDKYQSIYGIEIQTSAREKMEKVFLVAIMNHPYIISNVIESIVGIDFVNHDLNALKEKIVSIYMSYQDDLEAFAKQIEEIRHDVDKFEEDVIIHAGFVDKTVDDGSVLSGWGKLWEKYTLSPSVDVDLQNASSSLKSTFSEDDWQRLKALKQESILNRTKW